MGDEDLLGIVVGIGGYLGLMVSPRASLGIRRNTSKVLEDTLKSKTDVGIDENRREEDSDAPAMREAITQVKSIAPDPAPIPTHVAIGIKCEADSTYNLQSA